MSRQQGMTLLSIMMAGIFIIMFGIIALRIIPVYMQHQVIMESIEQLKDLPQTDLDNDSEISYIKDALLNKLATRPVAESLFDTLIIKPEMHSHFLESMPVAKSPT